MILHPKVGDYIVRVKEGVQGYATKGNRYKILEKREGITNPYLYERENGDKVWITVRTAYWKISPPTNIIGGEVL